MLGAVQVLHKMHLEKYPSFESHGGLILKCHISTQTPFYQLICKNIYMNIDIYWGKNQFLLIILVSKVTSVKTYNGKNSAKTVRNSIKIPNYFIVNNDEFTVQTRSEGLRDGTAP